MNADVDYQRDSKEPLKEKRKWIIPLLIIVAIFLAVAGFFAWKAGFTLNKISTKGGLLSSLVHSIPGVENKIKGEEEGRRRI